MPTQVEFYISNDGKNFKRVGVVDNMIDPQLEEAVTQELDVRRIMKARYVKMVAKNIGVCPDWHVGAGEKAWIFCDEIIVE